jgi:hypothetical protein
MIKNCRSSRILNAKNHGGERALIRNSNDSIRNWAEAKNTNHCRHSGQMKSLQNCVAIKAEKGNITAFNVISVRPEWPKLEKTFGE